MRRITIDLLLALCLYLAFGIMAKGMAFAQNVTPPEMGGVVVSLPKEIRIVWHKHHFFWKECVEANGPSQISAMGCFVMRDGVCHVYAPDPPFNPAIAGKGTDAGKWWALGHEVKHCFDGEFHT